MGESLLSIVLSLVQSVPVFRLIDTASEKRM